MAYHVTESNDCRPVAYALPGPDLHHNASMSLPEGWRQVSTKRFERDDGAVVKWSREEYNRKTWSENARMWVEYEPVPSERPLIYTRSGSGFHIQRAWKRPEQAMAALDTAFPLGYSLPG